MTDHETMSLTLERTLNAPVERVFEALTSAEAIGRWFGPSDEMRITVHEWDCQVGGNYRVEMLSTESGAHTCHGSFTEIVPGKKISYTWSWAEQDAIDSLVTFEVTANGTRTDLVLTHTGFPPGDLRERHIQGWTGSLERLARAV